MNGRRLVLIRHGQVDFDARDFTVTDRGRQWDPRLSEKGREQASLLAEDLSSMELPGALYRSQFVRCAETAEPFAKASGVEPIVDERLGEIFVGEWEGEAFEDILDSDEEVARRFHAREPLWTLAPGGESGPDFRRRVVEAVEEAIGNTPEGDVFMIVHGGVINAYLMHVLGITDRDMFFLPENTSVNRVAIEGERRTIQFINDVRHLVGPRSRSIPRPKAGRR